MSAVLPLAAAGDRAAPWIAFGIWAFFGCLGGFTMACKGRSAGWGLLLGLLFPILGNLVMFGLDPEEDQDPIVVAFFGAMSLGLLIMVLSLLAAIEGQ